MNSILRGDNGIFIFLFFQITCIFEKLSILFRSSILTNTTIQHIQYFIIKNITTIKYISIFVIIKNDNITKPFLLQHDGQQRPSMKRY